MQDFQPLTSKDILIAKVAEAVAMYCVNVKSDANTKHHMGRGERSMSRKEINELYMIRFNPESSDGLYRVRSYK